MIIAIDGPAGAGKSTVAKEVANELSIGYIDTGAMYRAITFKALESGTDLKDEGALGALAEKTNLEFKDDHIFMDGRDVTKEIRLPDVGEAVSIVSSAPPVRRLMVGIQRRVAAEMKDAVVEGRDIGTVVFPGADVKVFLTAGQAERVKRRLVQLRDKGLKIGSDSVRNEMFERDRLDSGRVMSPLQRAPDAALIDTTDKPIDGVVSIITTLAKEKARLIGN